VRERLPTRLLSSARRATTSTSGGRRKNIIPEQQLQSLVAYIKTLKTG